MAQCKWCGKSGFFLSINEIGLCSICTSVAQPFSNRVVEIVNTSQDIINKSNNLKTQISRCDVVITRLNDLLKYESRGVPIINPLPSELIIRFKKQKTELIISHIITEIERAKDKAEHSATINSGINVFNKASNIIIEYSDLIEDKNILKTLEETINDNIQRFKIKRYIEDAKKYEFKENTKKAYDLYMEALFILEKEDEGVNTLKNEIKTKVEMLKNKEVPKPKSKKQNNISHCVSCGNELKEGQKFCTKCGSKYP